jgi:hypothetical protein
MREVLPFLLIRAAPLHELVDALEAAGDLIGGEEWQRH